MWYERYAGLKYFSNRRIHSSHEPMRPESHLPHMHSHVRFTAATREQRLLCPSVIKICSGVCAQNNAIGYAFHGQLKNTEMRTVMSQSAAVERPHRSSAVSIDDGPREGGTLADVGLGFRPDISSLRSAEGYRIRDLSSGP